ncbi:MAG TPA: enoyl-CoA hydratase/isomerase family protein [bacterium]|nr:enoyl-CoA hydratase/isomerase family protein [bacterium]
MIVEIEAEQSARVIRMRSGDENRFNRGLVDALNRALDEIEGESSARSVVFTGAHEKYFSNGLDLSWLISQPHQIWSDFLVDFDRMLYRVFTYPKPVVAAINGHAFAGGLFLALCADWRVMREDRGWMCIPEIDLGLDLPPGNIALIEQAIGRRQTEVLSLSGTRLSAAEALKIGMIDETAPADQVLPRALETAKRLGAKKPAQYASHKKGLRAEAARILDEEDPPFIRSLVKARQGR